MPELDKDIAATMTPEELEAINAEESPEEKLIMRQQAEADAEDSDDDEEDESASSADTTKKAEPDAESGDEKAAPKAREEIPNGDGVASDDGETETPFKPKYQVQLPEDFASQVDALNEDFKVLAKQFKDGDIDFDNYNHKVTELNSKRDELTTLKTQAAVFEQMNAQTAEQEWSWTVSKFIKTTAKTEGIDYSKDEEKAADLDLFVKRLASDTKHADKPGDWFLTEAHRRVKALHGVQDSQQESKPDPKKAIQDAKNSRKPDATALPKNLSQVPGGDGPGDIGNDEFAELDSLDGLDLEAAIAKMTPAQRDRFLKAA